MSAPMAVDGIPPPIVAPAPLAVPPPEMAALVQGQDPAAAAAAPDGVFERQVLKLLRTLLAVRTYCAACVALFLKTWGWRPRYYK